MPQYKIRRAFHVTCYQDVECEADSIEHAVRLACEDRIPGVDWATPQYRTFDEPGETFIIDVQEDGQSVPVPPWADEVDAVGGEEVRSLRDCADQLILAYVKADPDYAPGRKLDWEDVQVAFEHACAAGPDRYVETLNLLRESNSEEAPGDDNRP